MIGVRVEVSEDLRPPRYSTKTQPFILGKPVSRSPTSHMGRLWLGSTLTFFDWL